MGGSSRCALLGPPVEIIILDVSPFCVGRHPHPRRRQRLGLPLSITLRHHSPPMSPPAGFNPVHYASSSLLCESLTLAATLPWTVTPTSSLPDSNLHLAGTSYLLNNLCGPSTPPHPPRIATLPLNGASIPLLPTFCVLHARPGPPSLGSPIESLHLPLSSAYSLSRLPQTASIITHSRFIP